MERARLRAARAEKHWTLEEAAAQIGCDLATLCKWEQGKARPQPVNVRRLEEVYGKPAEMLDLGEETPVLQVVPAASIPGLFKQDLTTRLLVLAHTAHRNSMEVYSTLTFILEEYDATHSGVAAQLTRRMALQRLAGFAFGALGLNGVKPVLRLSTEVILNYCTASIAACSELSKSVDPADLVHAFKCISAYMPTLEAIVKNVSQYRAEAASLLVRGMKLKTILAFHIEGTAKALGYAQLGVTYAKESGNPALQALALRQLGDTYNYEDQPEQALKAVQEARYILKKAAGGPPIPMYIQSWVYSGLAAWQARNGRSDEAHVSLQKAHELLAVDDKLDPDPQESSVALILWDGVTHYFSEQYGKALDSFEQTFDVDDEQCAAKMPVSRRVHIELINYAALASLKLPAQQKDMKKSLRLYTTGEQGGVALHSKQRQRESRLAREIIEGIWSKEERVKQLSQPDAQT